MNRNVVSSIGFCLALITVPAAAVETFTFDITGTGIQSFASVFHSAPPGDVIVPFDWFGHFSVTTSSAADGVYIGDDVLSISGFGIINPMPSIIVEAGIGPHDIAGNELFAFDTSQPTNFDPQYRFRPDVSGRPAVVTIASGLVTSIDALGIYQTSRIGLQGLAIGYTTGSVPRGITTRASGILTPIPEPSTLTLMFVGLASVGALSSATGRRRRTTTVGVLSA